MKSIRLVLLILSAGLGGPWGSVPASGASFFEREEIWKNFYLGSGIGAAFTEDVRVRSPDLALDRQKVTFSPGGSIDALVGYSFTDWIASEVQLGGTVTTTDREMDDSNDSWVFSQGIYLVNVEFTVPTGSGWRPFLGGGVGGVTTSLSDRHWLFGHDRTGEDDGLAWQLLAGVRYGDERFDCGIVYNYLCTGSRRFSDFDFRMPEVRTHSIALVGRFHF